jgi:O-antigen/teichoic acid export membrane protein
MSQARQAVDGNLSGNKGLRRRLIRGLSATALAPLATAIVQLGSVPILLHTWGAAKYGDWLLLSAIPSYLVLSDLGFGNASGSDMPMRVAANDREGALRTFQSSWLLVTSVSFFALLLAFATVWWIPWQRWLRLSSVSSLQAASIIIVLGAVVVVAQQNGVAESGFRSDGNFATGTFWAVILRVVEAVAATTMAVLGGSMLAVAATYLTVRCMGTVGYILLLRQKSPWIRYGVRHARLKTIKEMLAPAFGFMALPIGGALGQQGLQLVIGAKLGPVAVVSFSTLRTLSRISFQLIGVIKNAVWPELSRAFGTANIALARRLHRRAFQASLGFSILGGLLLWAYGPFIYRLWIRQSVSFDASCFHVLLLVVVMNSLWDTSLVIPMSVNSHCRLAVMYSAAAAISLGLAWILVPHLGTVGAAVALLVTDGWMLGISLRAALHQTDDFPKAFALALLTIPRLRRTLQAPAAEVRQCFDKGSD